MAHPAYSGPFPPNNTSSAEHPHRRAGLGGRGKEDTCRGRWGLRRLLPATALLPKRRRGVHGSPTGQKHKHTANLRATPPSLLSSSKECSRKVTPVLCPLRGSPEAPHRVGVELQALSLRQVTWGRLKKEPLYVPSGRKACSCPALTEDHEHWKLPQAR